MAVGTDTLSSSDMTEKKHSTTSIGHYTQVRQWLAQQHPQGPKQLARLDNFILQLRRGKFHQQDRRVVAQGTVDVLRHLIGSLKIASPAELHTILRGVGHELESCREPVIGNVIRRIMAAVREEASNESIATSANTDGGRLSLQSMLWALPQHVKKTSATMNVGGASGDNQRQESFADTDIVHQDYPDSFYDERPGLKSTVMEAIDEIVQELEELHKTINEQVVDHIHSGEIILTRGCSKTVELFLRAAQAKKSITNLSVLWVGGDASKQWSGLDVTVIPDAAVGAVMPRVHKVILPAYAVLANGSLVTASGGNLMALAAQHHSVPVVCTTGTYKLCPMFPHEGQDTLNDLLSPGAIMDYAEVAEMGLDQDVEFVNPLHDLIKPENIDLFITNAGSFQPSFLYRLLAEYYHSDDWNCFD